MKKVLINTSIAFALFAFAGCEKNDDIKAPYDTTGKGESQLKIIYASAYSLNPSVQLSIDDVRVSGLITGRTPFPGGGYNTNGQNFPDYLALTPGTKKLSVAIPKRGTNVDSIVLFSTQVVLKEKVSHTVNIMDTLAKTKALVVEDTLAAPAPGFVKYRFVNLMPNAPKLDLYYGLEKVASNIEYNTPGVVFNMPFQIGADWIIREPGSPTVLATYLAGATMTNQRMYTAFAMGYKGQTSATLKPYISFTINR